MTCGQHRISMKLMKGSSSELAHCCGVVRDGRAWDEDNGEDFGSKSTDAWYMHNSGTLYGNGKEDSGDAGMISEGQIISMEADLDKGTLRFWLDGQPHGPGWSSGVKGKLRWSVSMFNEGLAVQIVPTPELQPWTPWEEPERDDDEDY